METRNKFDVVITKLFLYAARFLALFFSIALILPLYELLSGHMPWKDVAISLGFCTVAAVFFLCVGLPSSNFSISISKLINHMLDCMFAALGKLVLWGFILACCLIGLGLSIYAFSAMGSLAILFFCFIWAISSGLGGIEAAIREQNHNKFNDSSF